MDWYGSRYWSTRNQEVSHVFAEDEDDTDDLFTKNANKYFRVINNKFTTDLFWVVRWYLHNWLVHLRSKTYFPRLTYHLTKQARAANEHMPTCHSHKNSIFIIGMKFCFLLFNQPPCANKTPEYSLTQNRKCYYQFHKEKRGNLKKQRKISIL